MSKTNSSGMIIRTIDKAKKPGLTFRSDYRSRNTRRLGMEERPHSSVMRDTDQVRTNQKGLKSRKSIGWLFCKGLRSLNFWIDYAGQEKFLKSLSDDELDWYNNFLMAYYSRTGDQFKAWDTKYKRIAYNDHRRRTVDMLNPQFNQKNYPRKVIHFSSVDEDYLVSEHHQYMMVKIYAEQIEEKGLEDEKIPERKRVYVRRGKTAAPRGERKNPS